MKKKLFVIFLIVILILVALIFLRINNSVRKMSGAIIKVEEKDLIVLSEDEGVFKISFSKDGNIGFKQGQEVKVYYTDKIIDSIWPAPIRNVKKIEIIKEKSDIELSKETLSFWYSSIDKVFMEVNEFTKSGIILKITDTNEIPFEYSNEYIIQKKVKNENYTGTGYVIGESTATSTAGFTGTGSEYNWIELNRKSETSMEDTIEILSSSQESGSSYITGRKIDWSKFYGELEEGEYIFKLLTNSTRFNCISISFSVNENGEVSYEEPEIQF